MRKHATIWIITLLVVSCAPQKPERAGIGGEVKSGRESGAVLEVGSEKFTPDEVRERLEAMRSELPGTEAGRDQLGAVAQFELLADEAERRGYGSDPRVVNEVKDAMAEAVRDDAAKTEVEVELDEAKVSRAFEAAKRTEK